MSQPATTAPVGKVIASIGGFNSERGSAKGGNTAVNNDEVQTQAVGDIKTKTAELAGTFIPILSSSSSTAQSGIRRPSFKAAAPSSHSRSLWSASVILGAGLAAMMILEVSDMRVRVSY